MKASVCNQLQHQGLWTWEGPVQCLVRRPLRNAYTCYYNSTLRRSNAERNRIPRSQEAKSVFHAWLEALFDCLPINGANRVHSSSVKSVAKRFDFRSIVAMRFGACSGHMLSLKDKALAEKSPFLKKALRRA